MKYERAISLALAVIFAVVGLTFLFFADSVLIFFNAVSAYLGMKQVPTEGYDFYLILASGYMYLVTLLAFLMYKQPDNRHFPFLLANAKCASSLLSFAFFLIHNPYLIYLANAFADGAIGILVIFMYFKRKRDL